MYIMFLDAIKRLCYVMLCNLKPKNRKAKAHRAYTGPWEKREIQVLPICQTIGLFFCLNCSLLECAFSCSLFLMTVCKLHSNIHVDIGHITPYINLDFYIKYRVLDL